MECHVTETLTFVTPDLFVPRLARDPEAFAQLAHRKMSAAQQRDKPLFLFHR